MKNNRALSFIIIFIIYTLSTLLGILLCDLLTLSFWIELLIVDIVVTSFIFIFSCILKNASVYDPYWSVQPIVITVAYMIYINNYTLTSILFVLVICLWGIRLTANWAYTFKNLNVQDWRYTMLKEKTKKIYPIINFIGIHMVPTLIVYTCVVPAVTVIVEGGTLNIIVIFGLLLSTFAFTLQGIADIQMHKFRKQKKTGFIRDGLWKYSRHPNYLGEILMWWGIGIAAIASLEDKIYLILGAILNTLLFLFVSIPMADKRNSKRGDMIKLKQETRMLLPIKK